MSSTEFHHNSFPQNQPSRSDSGDNAALHHTQPERYVDASALAEHLSVTHRQILEMTRRGVIPGHPLGIGASRRVWRYKISEVETAIASGARKPYASHKTDGLADESTGRTMPLGGPRSQRRKL